MAQGQEEIFETARSAISAELDPKILTWNFSEMLSQLRALINNTHPSSRKNATRSFCRRYLGMHGGSYREAQDWLSGKAAMPFDKIKIVLRVLASAGGETPDAEDSQKAEPAVPSSTGINRKLVEHTTTLFSSAMILVAEAGVRSDDLYDGDRIQIRTVLKEICDAFGIDVFFPEPEAARNKPVTRKEFAALGSRAQGRKRP